MPNETEDKLTESEETAEIAEETKETKNNYPTQLNLTIRAIVGGYVAYLAYQIVTSKGEMTPLMWVAVAVFIFAGVGLVALSIKHFVCGEYEGGKKDV